MAKARPHERVFALTLAFLFLATTVGSGVAVVWTIRKDNQAKKSTQDVGATQDALKKLQNKETGMLKGTKLTNFTPVDGVAELQKIDITEGNGDTVQAGASVTVHYTGALAKDGTIFESSKDSGQPASFPLTGVIKGWTDGVPGMKVGGTRRLLIPAAQAYGSQATGDIPANSDLVFDIELISIDK